MHAVVVGAAARDRGVVPGAPGEIEHRGAVALADALSERLNPGPRFAAAKNDPNAEVPHRLADLLRCPFNQVAHEGRRGEQRFGAREFDVAQDLGNPSLRANRDWSRPVSLQGLDEGKASKPEAQTKSVQNRVTGCYPRGAERATEDCRRDVQILLGEHVEGRVPGSARGSGDVDHAVQRNGQMQPVWVSVAIQGPLLRFPMASLVEEGREAAEVVQAVDSLRRVDAGFEEALLIVVEVAEAIADLLLQLREAPCVEQRHVFRRIAGQNVHGETSASFWGAPANVTSHSYLTPNVHAHWRAGTAIECGPLLHACRADSRIRSIPVEPRQRAGCAGSCPSAP